MLVKEVGEVLKEIQEVEVMLIVEKVEAVMDQ